jgi:hypothetical protein
MADINDPATADQLLQKAVDSFTAAETETEPKRTWLIREAQAASSIATGLYMRLKVREDVLDDMDDHHDESSVGRSIADAFPMR